MRKITATQLRTRVQESGGFTVQVTLPGSATYGQHGTFREGPREGFAVSTDPGVTRTFSPDFPFGAGDVALYTLDHLELLTRPGKHFGAWKDEETDVVHLDVITIVDDRAKAVELAETYGELAIWDLSRGEEIRVSA